MIVELFGPPGSGKTTLAHALGARLRDADCEAKIWSSYRPGEEKNPRADERSARMLAGFRRLARPALEWSIESGQFRRADGLDQVTALFVETFPSRGFLSSLRLRQYLTRLAGAWRAARADQIVIFDQGYVQLLFSSMLRRESEAFDDAFALLDHIPRSDLVIDVGAPIEVVRSRLAERERAMGLVGRLLEIDQGPLSRRERLARRLRDRLLEQNRQLVAVDSSRATDYARGVRDASEAILSHCSEARPFDPAAPLAPATYFHG